MQTEASDNPDNKTFSQSLNIDKSKIVCKNGFCSLPNHDDNSGKSEKNINFFDPI